MHINSILAGAAIALAASFGSAWAGDGFATLDGVAAVPMTSEHMEAIRGVGGHGGGAPGVIIITPEVSPTFLGGDTNPNAPPPIVVTPGGVVGGV